MISRCKIITWSIIGICIWASWIPIISPFAIKVLSWSTSDKITQVTISQLGAFGDIFGSLNALLTGGAFIGLLYTIHLQRTQLQEQRDQIKNEHFGETFFRLLEMYKESISDIKFGLFESENFDNFSGRIAFEKLMTSFNQRLNTILRDSNTNYPAKQLENTIIEKFGGIYNNNVEVLGRYYRNINLIFRLISEKCVNDKELYIDILRGCLKNRDNLIQKVKNGLFRVKFRDECLPLQPQRF